MAPGNVRIVVHDGDYSMDAVTLLDTIGWEPQPLEEPIITDVRKTLLEGLRLKDAQASP